MSTSPSSAPIRIGLVGTFEVANYGDCLFPVVYQSLLERRLPQARFTYHSPFARSTSPLADYGPVRALPETLASGSFDEDALILCGGETLALGHSSGTYNFPASTLSAYARLWLAPTYAASGSGTAFFAHCVGMPTKDLEDRPLIAQGLAHADAVALRDSVSASRLGGRFGVEVDPMFAVSTCRSPEDWDEAARACLPKGFEPGEYICAHISAPYLSEGLGPWCDQILRMARATDLPILLLPVCHFLADRMVLQKARDLLVAKGIDGNRIALPGPGHEQVYATAALIGRSAGIVTTSLHALVTAVSFAVPFAGYSGKGKGQGKHRQTLKAARVEQGVVTDICELADTLLAQMQVDLDLPRDEAIGLATSGFDRLIDHILAAANVPSRERPMPSELVERLLAEDRKPTLDRKFEFKRMVLRTLKSVPAIASLIERRHIARSIKNISN